MLLYIETQSIVYMKNIITLFTLVAIFISGCTSSMKRKVEEADDEKRELKDDYHEEVILPDNASVLDDVPVNPKIVRPTIVDNKGIIDIYKHESQFIEFQIESMGYKRIVARITSDDPQANIRFTQIILPDGTADGPFSRELKYDLPEDGIYKLEVSEDMMAGEPWSGTFVMEFELFYD